jgi:hypothetical protein
MLTFQTWHEWYRQAMYTPTWFPFLRGLQKGRLTALEYISYAVSATLASSPALSASSTILLRSVSFLGFRLPGGDAGACRRDAGIAGGCPADCNTATEGPKPRLGAKPGGV